MWENHTVIKDNLRIGGLWSKGMLLVAETVEEMRSKAKKRSFNTREILVGEAIFESINKV